MNTAVVVTKLDPLTKKAAMKTANELGIPLSVVIKAFLKQFIRTKSVTFESSSEEPSEYLKNVIKQAEENYRKKNYSPSFTNAKDAINYLEDQGI